MAKIRPIGKPYLFRSKSPEGRVVVKAWVLNSLGKAPAGERILLFPDSETKPEVPAAKRRAQQQMARQMAMN